MFKSPDQKRREAAVAAGKVCHECGGTGNVGMGGSGGISAGTCGLCKGSGLSR